jgi:hypothetical protein
MGHPSTQGVLPTVEKVWAENSLDRPVVVVVVVIFYIWEELIT